MLFELLYPLHALKKMQRGKKNQALTMQYQADMKIFQENGPPLNSPFLPPDCLPSNLILRWILILLQLIVSELG